jgi:hypothetical protein
MINKLNKSNNTELTYGDVAFVTTISTLSWILFTSYLMVKITYLEIWNKPIK